MTTKNLTAYIVQPNFFSKEECIKILHLTKEFNPAYSSQGHNVSLNTEFKNSKTQCLYYGIDNKFIYDKITDQIKKVNDIYWNFDLQTIETMQISEYVSNCFIKPHIDIGGVSNNRKITVIVQLSDESDYEGGDVKIYDGYKGVVFPDNGLNPESLSKKIGSIILFPSYLLHEVYKVTKGIRYSLTVCAIGEPFK